MHKILTLLICLSVSAVVATSCSAQEVVSISGTVEADKNLHEKYPNLGEFQELDMCGQIQWLYEHKRLENITISKTHDFDQTFGMDIDRDGKQERFRKLLSAEGYVKLVEVYNNNIIDLPQPSSGNDSYGGSSLLNIDGKQLILHKAKDGSPKEIHELKQISETKIVIEGNETEVLLPEYKINVTCKF